MKCYNDFINKVNELGFMTLNTVIDGFPAVADETEGKWFTGNSDTDPWCWKDRCSQNKQLAFGNFFGGKKGFISPDYYSVFYVAYHPIESVEERWATGKITSDYWNLWNLISENAAPLSTHDLRRLMNVTAKSGGSSLDSAIKSAQLNFDITIAGSRQKTDKLGNPYGTPAILYDIVDNYIPLTWLENKQRLDKNSAKQKILKRAREISHGLSDSDLLKLFKY